MDKDSYNLLPIINLFNQSYFLFILLYINIQPTILNNS